jgi:uncharacterized protein (TIGR02284 family)
MSHEACLVMLMDLIETCREGERGFALATCDNCEPSVADALKEGEEWCHSAALELQEQMLCLGARTGESRPATAPVYRGWVNFKAVPVARGTKLILEECERGGDYVHSRYSAAMDFELPESVRTIVVRQYQRLIAIQGRLRLLRNRYPATDIPQGSGYRLRRS